MFKLVNLKNLIAKLSRVTKGQKELTRMEEARNAALKNLYIKSALNMFSDPQYGVEVRNNGRTVRFSLPPLTEANSTFQYYQELSNLPVCAGEDFIFHWYYKLVLHLMPADNFVTSLTAGYGTTTYYTKCVLTKFTPQFYKKPVHKHFLTPGLVEYELLKTGNSSFVYAERWLNNANELLVSSDVVIILVDYNTRLPTNLPQSYLDMYRTPNQQLRFDLQEPDAIPDDALNMECDVTDVHIDPNGHMNVVPYFHIFEQIFQTHVKETHQRHLQVKEVLLVMQKENVLGDKLCLKYWQDVVDGAVVHVYCWNKSRQHTSSYAKLTMTQHTLAESSRL